MELIKAVYAVSKRFPPEEWYALTDQIRRAVVSIPSNIACTTTTPLLGHRVPRLASLGGYPIYD